MPRRANTQTQQEAVQENAAVQANTGADMQMEAAITKTQPEKGVLALADVKIGDFMTIRNVRIKEDDYGLTVAMPKTKWIIRDFCHFYMPEDSEARSMPRMPRRICAASCCVTVRISRVLRQSGRTARQNVLPTMQWWNRCIPWRMRTA